MKKAIKIEIPASVVEAVRCEFPNGFEDTIEGIASIREIATNKNGAVLYDVNAVEDFAVIEGETGTGVFYRTLDEAREAWNA